MQKKLLLGSMLMLISVLFVLGCSGKNSSEVTGAAVSFGEGMVKIPLDDITRNAKFFEYDANGVEVKYFVVLG